MGTGTDHTDRTDHARHADPPVSASGCRTGQIGRTVQRLPHHEPRTPSSLAANSNPKLLSPKDLALAIGASESSLKRWTDQGLLVVSRTAGGHRRIPLPEAIRFVRSRRLPLVKPEILGLPASFGVESDLRPGEHDRPDDVFTDLLRAGHDIGARNHLVERFMRGETIAALADGPIRSAMRDLGEFWKQGPEGILIEHRATEICAMVIQDLRSMVTPEQPRGTAIGGSLGGDPYKLPPLIAASVLNECGVHAVNLGADTPVEVLEIAAFGPETDERPDILWLNASSVSDPDTASRRIAELAARCTNAGILFCIGGREAHRLELGDSAGIVVHDSMRAFAATILDHLPEPRGSRATD